MLVRVLVLTAALAGFGQAAQTDRSAPPKSTTALSKAAAVPRALPDVQVEHAIQQKFAKSKINAERFTVTVRGGVATIEGKTNVIQHKGVATRLARSGGATVVKNNIQVSDEARAKAAAHLANGKANANGSNLQRATVLPPGKPK